MNQLRVIPVIKAVISCESPDWRFKSHRDGEILLIANENNNKPECNDGYFSQLLQFRIDAGDEYLKSNLSFCMNNAKTSKQRLNISL